MIFMNRPQLKFGPPVHGHRYNRFWNIVCRLFFGISLFESQHKHVRFFSTSTNKIWIILDFHHLKFDILFHLVDIPQRLQHTSSIICGLALAYSTLGTDFVYSLGFTSLEYIVLLAISMMKQKKFGIILTVFCLAALIIGLVNTSIYHSLKYNWLTWNSGQISEMFSKS